MCDEKRDDLLEKDHPMNRRDSVASVHNNPYSSMDGRECRASSSDSASVRSALSGILEDISSCDLGRETGEFDSPTLGYRAPRRSLVSSSRNVCDVCLPTIPVFDREQRQSKLCYWIGVKDTGR